MRSYRPARNSDHHLERNNLVPVTILRAVKLSRVGYQPHKKDAETASSLLTVLGDGNSAVRPVVTAIGLLWMSILLLHSKSRIQIPPCGHLVASRIIFH